jgi:hypothetical protein
MGVECWKRQSFCHCRRRRCRSKLNQDSVPYEATSRRLQLERINPNHLSESPTPFWRCHVSYATQHSRPQNIDVDEVNNAILELLSKELHTYLSANSLISTEEGASVVARVSMDSLYPV